MTAESASNDPGVAGASAGAEVRWLGGRFWGVSESIVGSLTPRIAGETEIQTVDIICSAQDAHAEDSQPDYEGLPQGASTSTHMLAGAVAGIMEHCLMFPIDCVKVAQSQTPRVFLFSPPAPPMRSFHSRASADQRTCHSVVRTACLLA